jgi:predicted outer membrane protein
MKKRNWFYALALAVSLTWVACDDDDDDNVLDPELNDSDEEFVEWAAQSNLAEIEMGKIAVSRGISPLVRDFGQQMVDDHTTAQNELRDIDNDFRDIDWPEGLNSQNENLRSQLENASEETFDSLYMRTKINMHQTAITRYQTASSTASETRVKDYAARHLPTLEEHHERADSIFMAITTEENEGTDGGTDDGTTDGGTDDGTTDGGTDDGTTDGGTDDGTTDGGTDDGTTDGGTDDGTTDGGTDDGTTDGGTDDGTTDSGTDDGTTDGGTDDGTTGGE